MGTKRLKNTRKIQRINEGTGEVTHQTIEENFSIKTSSSEEYFMTFLSGVNAIFELSHKSDIKVLAQLCTIADFNTGRVVISPMTRKEIMKKIGVSSPQSFTNSLRRLKENDIIKGERGEYEVNPQMFWRGETNERAKILSSKRLKINAEYINNFENE